MIIEEKTASCEIYEGKGISMKKEGWRQLACVFCGCFKIRNWDILYMKLHVLVSCHGNAPGFDYNI